MEFDDNSTQSPDSLAHILRPGEQHMPVDDAMRTSDLLSSYRFSGEYGERTPAQATRTEGMPSGDIAPRISQRHYIDGVLREGDYPDRTVREVVHAKMERIQAARDQFYTALDAAPDLNGQFEEEIDWMRRQVAGDLGARALELPVSVLAPDHFKEVRETIGLGRSSAAGMYRHGRIVICDNPEIRARHGLVPFINVLGHEFAHGMYVQDNKHVVTFPFEGNEQSVARGDTVVADRIVRVVDGVGHGIPADDALYDPLFNGSFLEEGVVESYALEKRDAFMRRPYVSNKMWCNVPVDAEATTFVNYGDDGLQLVDPDTGMICLPWKYAYSVGRGPDNEIVATTSGNPLAALGIDLLEAYYLPDLRNELLVARNEPELKLLVRDRMNRIYAGNTEPLHTRLSRLGYSTKDFMAGLRMIIHALHLTDEPISRVARKL